MINKNIIQLNNVNWRNFSYLTLKSSMRYASVLISRIVTAMNESAKADVLALTSNRKGWDRDSQTRFRIQNFF